MNPNELQPRYPRSSSMTSFSSYNSSMSVPSIQQHHPIPRGSSTTDMLYMEQNFTRQTRKHHPNSPLFTPHTSNSSLKDIQPRTRNNSTPNLPRLNSLQSGSTQDLLSFSAPSQRKASLQTSSYNPYQFQKMQIQQQQKQQRFHQPQYSHHASPQQQYRSLNPTVPPPPQQQQQRRHNSRPVHDAPFTFPNGEVYIPRSKQRVSYPNLHQLDENIQSQTQQQQQQPPPPPQQQQNVPSVMLSRPKSVSPPIRQRAQFNANPIHQQIDPQIQHHHSLTLSIDTYNSSSTSPSPSGTSRTNSSVHETTPPSSVDDLTILHTSTLENFEKVNSASIPYNLESRSNSLGMIEESSPVDYMNVSSPNTLQQNSIETIEESPKLSSSAQSTVPETHNQTPKETLKEPMEPKIDSIPKIPSPIQEYVPIGATTTTTTASSSTFASGLHSSQNVHKQKLRSTPSLNSFQQSMHSSIKRTDTITTTKSETKKKSIVKRMFSKVFSRKNSLKVQEQPITRTISVTSTIKQKPSLKKQTIKTNDTSSFAVSHSTNTAAPLIKHEIHFTDRSVVNSSITPINSSSKHQSNIDSHQISKNIHENINDNLVDYKINDKHDDAHSDQFSFFDGDEDNGLNVNKEKDDFNSDDVLKFMFAKLDSPTRLDNESIQEKKVINEQTPIKKIEVQPSNDDEDQVISLDDIELIEKLIEYGETSFPDLASPDLGQSQRKLIRSKSIERRKSIRSISSASRDFIKNNDEETNNNPTESINDNNNDENNINKSKLQVIFTNEPKEPSLQQSVPSILKKKRNGNETLGSKKFIDVNNSNNNNNNNNLNNNNTQTLLKKSKSLSPKKVEFTNQIFVNNTYPSHVYNRHSKSLSSFHLSPHSIQQIKYELNEFKSKMDVHEQSKTNTHFFL